jgi:hypothetical protein
MRGTISTSISTSGYVAVRLPANVGCNTFSLWTLDGATWYYATKSDGSDGILVTDGSVGFPLTIAESYSKSAAGTIICYAKGTTSTFLTGIVTA